MRANNQKILICLPQKLVAQIDRVKTEKQVSRVAFIRESVIRNLEYYHRYERGRVWFPRAEFNCWGHAKGGGEISVEKGEPPSKDHEPPQGSLHQRFNWKSLLGLWQ